MSAFDDLIEWEVAAKHTEEGLSALADALESAQAVLEAIRKRDVKKAEGQSVEYRARLEWALKRSKSASAAHYAIYDRLNEARCDEIEDQQYRHGEEKK